ncbi:phosphohydrolase [Pedobacter lusitanus]|uniref:Phosphohydrolase n=1 Tax=Pedobacter lusitanus TaxID=1503925 RepID=A0A0D0EYQ2_9SPHI|nr:metallophosphoesterase [Pedobacter lusitanus]KIO74503.1 phosphohydrolase [Pedobacter lusitanus]
MKRKINLLPFVLFAAFIFLLNWYVLSGLQSLSSSGFVTPVFCLFIIAAIGSLFLAIRRMDAHGMDWFFKISSHLLLTLFAAEVVLSVFLFIGDVPRIFTGHPRNIYWVEVSFLMFLLTVFLFVYGMIFGKYNYRVIHHVLYFDDLPEKFEGFKLAQISDVHAGSFNNPTAVQRGISLINQQKADLFVFTGDLVNNKAEEIKPWISYFSKIKAPYGQFSVLGNHDYGDYIKWKNDAEKTANLEQLKTYHQELGFHLLLDTHVEIKKDDQKIILAGVENWGLGFGERGDLKKSLNGTADNDFKILLSHDPSHWEEQVKVFRNKVHLTLAGHTHGMQFGLEALGIKWSPVKYRYAHWAGIKSENGRVLNINRGFGFIGFSGRIGIWPEITVIELRKNKAHS